MLRADGQGHREADPPAVVDRLPDGGAPSGHRPGDPRQRRGLQRDERGCLRAPLLRRPRRARVPGHRAGRRPARRWTRRAGELLAPARELPSSGDRVHRLRARRAADGALAARRGVRLRRAAAPRPPADLLGPPEPAPRPRPALGRARHHRLGGRPRPLPSPGEDRHRDLAAQDDHVRLLHDGARRRGRAQGRPLPAALPGRAVLPRGALPRARRRARLPPLADPRQGLLRDQGRARLPAARRLRSARVRKPDLLAVRRPGRRGGDPRGRPHRLADRAPLRPVRGLSGLR